MWAYLKNRSAHKLLLLLLIDVAILIGAIYIAYVLKFSVRTFKISFDLAIQRANLFLFVSVFFHLISLYVYGLYSFEKRETPAKLLVTILASIVTSTALLMVVQFFVPGYWIGRVVLTLQVPISVTGLYAWRSIFYKTRLSLAPLKRLALFGSGPLVKEFMEKAMPALSHRYVVRGIWVSGLEGSWPGPEMPGVKRYNSLRELLEDRETEAIAFEQMARGLSKEDVRALLQRSCEGWEIKDMVSLYKSVTGKVPVGYVDEGWLLSYLGIQGGPSQYYLKVKRLMDVGISALVLLVALPIMGLIALLIKLDSPGPLIFKQERLGRYRKNFNCIKFRTMVNDAEKDTGPVWSSGADPRITTVGRWLRKLRLDELPQLINVLKGDMSLIGPRPIRAYFADLLAREIPLYELRFALKPGLTGWAQVQHPYANSRESQIEKFEYDLFYIQNASLFLDLMILVMTIRTVFNRKGQ